MKNILNLKKGKIDKLLQKKYKIYDRSLKRQERILGGTLASGDYASIMVPLCIMLSGLYDLPENPYAPDGKNKGYFTNDAIIYCANMDIILSYLWVNIFKRNRNFASRRLYRAYQVASYMYPGKVEDIRICLEKICKGQNDPKIDPDELSGYHGELLRVLASWDDEYSSIDLEDMCYYLGKFEYMLTCYLRMKSDQRHDRYNPLLFLKSRSPEIFDTYCKSHIKSFAEATIACFNRINPVKNYEIIRYLVYLGVNLRYETSLGKDAKRRII